MEGGRDRLRVVVVVLNDVAKRKERQQLGMSREDAEEDGNADLLKVRVTRHEPRPRRPDQMPLTAGTFSYGHCRFGEFLCIQLLLSGDQHGNHELSVILNVLIVHPHKFAFLLR